MASAVIVSVVAILQVGHLFGIPEFLFTYYDLPFSTRVMTVERGTSTLASAFGVGDVMIMNLIIALVLLRFMKAHRLVLIAATLVFLCGCMASGELSEYIGLAAATIAFASLSGNAVRRKLPLLFGAGAVAAAFLWPVIARRFEGFSDQQGMPSSWDVRWENLQRFFVPKLLEGMNWLIGVRPAPRVPAPEKWREFVYIESGYLWLVWIGGLPFLLAFVYFAYTALGTLRQIARTRVDAVAAAATAGFCYLMALLILTLFDPHLTLRGTADLFFPLLAMSLVSAPATARGGMRQFSRAAIPGGRPMAYPIPARGGYVATSD
jgi:hypothetical protein